MARFSAGVKTGVGTTTLPFAALASGASVGFRLREVGISNTTNTAQDIKLVRLTTAGTPGSSQTETRHDPSSATAGCSFNTTYTSTGPTLEDLGYRFSLGAAIGAGVIWTFGDAGIVSLVGAANGVGVVVENGTGLACQIYMVWDE
jgi:hypothetical protein